MTLLFTVVGDTDVESAPSSAASSLFLESRHSSWETQATQDSFTTPQKKRSHEVKFKSPHSVATPPPGTPDSPSPSKALRRDPSRILPIALGLGSSTKQVKGPKESAYSRGPTSFHSPNERDLFSPASSSNVTPKPAPLSLKIEPIAPKPAGHGSVTHNAPPSEPNPIHQRTPRRQAKLKPSLKALPPPIEHGLNSPPGFVYIAHDDLVQRLIESRQLAWGVQWEIARGITDGHWTWEDVTPEKLDKLRGTNTEAAWKVDGIIREKQHSAATLNEENYRLWFVHSSHIQFALLT
jgi:hypothetical protein